MEDHILRTAEVDSINFLRGKFAKEDRPRYYGLIPLYRIHGASIGTQVQLIILIEVYVRYS